MAYFDLTEEQLEDVRRTEARRRKQFGEELADANFAQQEAEAKASGDRPAVSVEGRRGGYETKYGSGLTDSYLRTITAFPEPEGAARDYALAMDSGLPMQLIKNNPQVRKQAETIRMMRGKAPVLEMMKSKSPIAAEYLSTSGVLPFVSDEPESLVKSEGFISSAVNGYRLGSLQQRLGRLRARQLLDFSGSPDEKTDNEINEIKEELEKYAAARPDALLPRMFYGGGTQMAQRRDQIARGAAYAGLAAGAVGLAAATGGLSVPGTLMTAAGSYAGASALAGTAAQAGFMSGASYEGFVQEAGLAYDELLDAAGRNGEKLDPNVARAAALMVGAANAGIEFMQLGMFLKHFPGAGKLLGRQVVKKAVESPTFMNLMKKAGKAGVTWLKEVGLESGQEVVQQTTNIVARNAAKALSRGEFDYDSASEIADELISTFGSSAIDFSLPMLAGPLAGGMRNLSRAASVRRYRIERARGLAVVQEMVNSAAKEGPLASRSPGAMRDYLITLNDQIKNPFATVYLPAEAVSGAAAGMDAEKRAGLLKTLGVSDVEFSDALAAGSDLVVDSADFAMLAQSDEAAAKALFAHLKADADGPETGDVKAATKEHAGFIRSAIGYASRVIAPSAVSEESLVERAEAEGIGDVYVKASVFNQLFQEAAPQADGEARDTGPAAAEAQAQTAEEDAEVSAPAEGAETQGAEAAREGSGMFAGITLDEALSVIGVSRVDFDKALENDEDLRISIDRLISGDLPEQLYGSLRDDLMAEAGALTIREAREWEEAFAETSTVADGENETANGGDQAGEAGGARGDEQEKKVVSGVTEEEAMDWREKAERDVRDREGAALVRANIKAQLLLAGYGDDAAQASAEVFAGKVMRSARRMGLNPETYFRVYANVKFVRGDATAESMLNQLTRERGAVTRTEAFKAWFGDWENDPENASRILDSNGEPLVVYRGDTAGMTSFGSAQGNYFISDKDTAEGYAGKKGSLYPVYLNIRNPFVFSEENVASLKEALSARFDDWFDMDSSELAHDGDFQRLRNLYAAFRNDDGSAIRDLYNDFLPRMDESMGDEEARDLMGRSLHDFYTFSASQLDFRDMDILNPYLRMLGFDGVIRPYDPLATGGGKSEYITFTPEQVKSVENTGTFDAGNPNIYLQPVWHGSPYKFDKFSLEHIGEGEGAQAFGWGLYFAGEKEVSEWYREKLAEDTNKIKLFWNGEEIAPAWLPNGTDSDELRALFRDFCAAGRSPKEFALAPVAHLADICTRAPWGYSPQRLRSNQKEFFYSPLYSAREAAEAFLEEAGFTRVSKEDGGRYDRYIPTEREREYAREVLKWLDENEDKFTVDVKKNKGQLFKVDIPDEADGNYLLWDSAVTEEQAGRIVERMKKEGRYKELYVLALDGERFDRRKHSKIATNVFAEIEDCLYGYEMSLEEAIAFCSKLYEKNIEKAEKDEFEYLADTLRDELEWLNENKHRISTVSDNFNNSTPSDYLKSRFGHNLTGRDLCRGLQDEFGSDKEASLLLRDAGFAGIKYLDGSSRRRGEGNYNYVIFDDAAVNILETYYQALNESTSEEFKKALPDRVFDSFDGAKEYLRKQLEGLPEGVSNESDNILAKLSVKGIKKMLSDKATNKSIANGFTTKDHITAAANIVKLYRNSELLKEHDDSKGRDAITKIKRFGAPVVLPDAEEASVAYITVREIYGKDNKLYSVELMSFELLKAKEMPSGNLNPPAAEEGGSQSSKTEGISRLSEKLEAVNADYAKFEQKARGAISIPHTFGEGSLIQITITPNADASTAVHEMSHYFLWEMERLAQLLPHDAELQADLATTKKWLGWRDGQTDWTRGQQEQWARGFEAYLREGRAPSVELASAFARFKKWLCEIYKSITELGVELSDDMRGVFDRLLASEEETEAAMMLEGADSPGGGESEAPVAERIVAARGEAMAERRAESMKADVLSRILREAEEARKLRESKEASEEMERITADVRMMPVYRAIAAMRSGRFKMSDDRLIADHGPDVYEGLPEGVSGADGQMSADEVAEEFGYGSGEELISALKAAPSVEDEARARYQAAHPESDMREEAKAAAEEEAYGDDALSELIAEREDIAEAAGTSDEDWAAIEAEDEAARAAWDDPRSRPNCVRWIRENGGLSYASVKLAFGDEQAQELLKRCGPGLFKDGALSLDVAAESMKNEGAYFGMGAANADQELFDVLMGDDPPVSPLEIAKREGFAEARAYAKKLAEERRARKAERDAGKALRKEAREAEAERKRTAAEAEKKARREAREELKRRAEAAAEAVFSAARDAVDGLYPNKLKKKIEAYKAAEAAAKKEYGEALRARDWERAGHAKDRQILNRALAVEARRAAKTIRGARKRIDRQLRRTRKDTWGMSQAWLDQIDLLFARFGIIPMSARMETTQPLAGFAAGMASEGHEPPVADWILNGAGPKGARSFTVGQARDFNDTLVWLIHGAHEAGRMSRKFERRNVGAVAEEVAANIRKQLSVLIDKNAKAQAERKNFDMTKVQRLKRSISLCASRMSKIEMFCRVLDGGERMGPAYEAIFEPIARAENEEYAMRRVYTRRFKELLYKSYSRQERRTMAKKRWYQMIGKNLSKEEVLCIALNTGNKLNMERVKSGFDWSEQQLRYVIENTLDGRDWDFVQGVWDLLDTLWPQIAALQRDVSGWTPERVRPMAFTWRVKGQPGNTGRTVAGGYYPIAYNREAGRNRFIRRITKQELLEDLYGGFWSMAQTKQGHTKARAESTGYELLLNLNVIPTHLTNVIHDLTHRRAIIDVNKLLTYWKQVPPATPFDRAKIVHPLEDAIIDAMGEDVYDQFLPWLKYVASGEGNPLHAIDMVCRWLRRRTQIVVLGLKAAVSLSQINGFFPAMHEVGFWPLLKNIFYFYRNPAALADNARAIWEKSEAMRSRSTSRDRDVRSLVDSLHKRGKFDSLQESYFTFINLFDAGVVLPIWTTAYEKGLAAGWDEDKAIGYADSVVRGTQDIGTPKDLSAIQRGRDTYKIFTMFYNAMNTQLNMVMEDIWLYRAGKVSKGHLIGTALYVVAMPAIFGALITGHGPKDDEDDEKGFFAQLFDDPARVAAWCAKQAAKYPFAFVPLLRDVESYALDDFGRYRVSPAFAPAEQIGKTVRDFAAAADDIWDGEAEKVSTKKLARDAFTTGGYLFGYPAGQLNITFGAIWDLMEGEKEVRARDFFLYRKR